MEGRSDLLKVFEANDLGNGLIDQILLRDVLVRAGCSALLVEQLFHLAGGDTQKWRIFQKGFPKKGKKENTHHYKV